MTVDSTPMAKPQHRLSLVRAAVDKQRLAIDKKRYRAQRRLTYLTVIQLTTLAATPVLLSLSNMDSFSWYTVAGLILSAIAVCTGSLLTAFSFRERWRNFVRVSGSLQELKLSGDLLASLGDTLTDDQILEFREQYQTTLANGNENWQKAVAEPKAVGA